MSRCRIRRLLAVVALLGALFLVTACVPSSPELSQVENDVNSRHNVLRMANGLPYLMLDTGMSNNAQSVADSNAQRTLSCSSGVLQHSTINQWGYGTGAENLACVPGCPADAGRAWDMWLNSPGHRASIERAIYKRIGIGVTCNGSVQILAVHFAA